MVDDILTDFLKRLTLRDSSINIFLLDPTEHDSLAPLFKTLAHFLFLCFEKNKIIINKKSTKQKNNSTTWMIIKNFDA